MDKKHEVSPDDRRGFFAKMGVIVVGSATALVPMIAGFTVFFDPLRHKGGGGDFIKITSLGALPEDGIPRRFPVLADRTDAWNRYPNTPVGAVYLRRIPGGGVEALNMTCPHAGCPVEYKPATKNYLCPCHDSRFNLDGSLGDLKSPSPRGMDGMQAEIRNETEVWVKFQNFEPGKKEKVAS